LAVCSSNRVTQRPESHRLLTNADTAVRTWHTVSSGFFPPKFLVDLRQEQMAHRRQDHVTLQTLVLPPLVVIQAQFPFLILKSTLDTPA
jgi:hypothetical protein